eukprot:TRINITY_DN95188_c0_g1_i1.p2 TRINITY_DN95188_c0_g1~~TRINITY_DN95188_c0_g1_i1.p2  ORF type:complete len:151 (+),score=50.57 TRINITY_DN95188_c0_g1_i1:89-541(+)
MAWRLRISPLGSLAAMLLSSFCADAVVLQGSFLALGAAKNSSSAVAMDKSTAKHSLTGSSQREKGGHADPNWDEKTLQNTSTWSDDFVDNGTAHESGSSRRGGSGQLTCDGACVDAERKRQRVAALERELALAKHEVACAEDFCRTCEGH